MQLKTFIAAKAIHYKKINTWSKPWSNKLRIKSLNVLQKLTYICHNWNKKITHIQTNWNSCQSYIAHQSPFFLKEHPSVSLALPPVGWQRTVWQLPHTTTVWEWLNTVVLPKNKRPRKNKISNSIHNSKNHKFKDPKTIQTI